MSTEETFLEPCYIEELALVPETETTCPTCFAEFLDIEDLNIHISQVHSVITKKPCQLCPTMYTDMYNYAEHVRDCHLNNIYSCLYCKKIFTDQISLYRHRNKHTTSEKYLLCSQCNASFNISKHLEAHELFYHNNDKDGLYLKCVNILSSLLTFNVSTLLQTIGERVLICKACDFSSIDLPTYLKHIKENKCEVYVCDDCNTVHATRKALISHLRRKFKCNRVIEQRKCVDCKTLLNVRNLIEHNKVCQFKCITCGQKFLTVEELSNHQSKHHPRSIHNIIKCKFCLREYVGNDALKKHVTRSHKPNFKNYKYKCCTCGNIYQHPQKLFAHYLTKHKDLEPYNCKICNKKFRIRKRFTLHIKLTHNSQGYVEFNENYHVFFSENKSENPFIPTCVLDKADIAEFDTDSDATDIERDKKPKRKPEQILIESSDDEPLLEVRKRLKKNENSKNKASLKRKKQLTCRICLKYCYTYQNYENHLKLHKKNVRLSCVKCSQTFYDQRKLNTHIETEHKSSKLTDTLKKIIAKRNRVDKTQKNKTEKAIELTKSEKFLKTLKKVNVDKCNTVAKISLSANKGLSVQKFLEDFSPEETKCKINTNVTIRQLKDPIIKKPVIKLKKFKPEKNIIGKLKMPEKFKSVNTDKVNVKIKMIHSNIVLENDCDFTEDNTVFNIDEKNIPDIAQEVLLHTDNNVPNKIVLPKIPKDVKSIHVATLHPEAPFYKIIKINADQKKAKKCPKKRNTIIQLEDGTKLINANPLAHLLGDKSVENILQPLKNKHYTPAITDYEEVLAKAMLSLKEPKIRKKKSSKD